MVCQLELDARVNRAVFPRSRLRCSAAPSSRPNVVRVAAARNGTYPMPGGWTVGSRCTIATPSVAESASPAPHAGAAAASPDTSRPGYRKLRSGTWPPCWMPSGMLVVARWVRNPMLPQDGRNPILR